MPAITDSAGRTASYHFRWVVARGYQRLARLTKRTPDSRVIETSYFLRQDGPDKPVTCNCPGYRKHKHCRHAAHFAPCFKDSWPAF